MKNSFDTCVYKKTVKLGIFVLLLLYVEDILIASCDKQEIDKIKVALSNEFEMKDLGEAKKTLWN